MFVADSQNQSMKRKSIDNFQSSDQKTRVTTEMLETNAVNSTMEEARQKSTIDKSFDISLLHKTSPDHGRFLVKSSSQERSKFLSKRKDPYTSTNNKSLFEGSMTVAGSVFTSANKETLNSVHEAKMKDLSKMLFDDQVKFEEILDDGHVMKDFSSFEKLLN